MLGSRKKPRQPPQRRPLVFDFGGNVLRHGPVDANLSGQVTLTEYEVEGVTYRVHTKRGAPPEHPKTMRVDYRLGFNRWVSEFICVEHTGWARKRGESWRRRRRSAEHLNESHKGDLRGSARQRSTCFLAAHRTERECDVRTRHSGKGENERTKNEEGQDEAGNAMAQTDRPQPPWYMR